MIVITSKVYWKICSLIEDIPGVSAQNTVGPSAPPVSLLVFPWLNRKFIGGAFVPGG